MPTMRTLMGPLDQVAAGTLPADLHELMSEPLLTGVRPWRGDQWHQPDCPGLPANHGAAVVAVSLDQVRRNVCRCYDDNAEAVAAAVLVHAGLNGTATLRDALRVRYASILLGGRHTPASASTAADAQLHAATDDGRAVTALMAGSYDPQPGRGLAPPFGMARQFTGGRLVDAIKAVMRLTAAGAELDQAVAHVGSNYDRPSAAGQIAEAVAWTLPRLVPEPAGQLAWMLDYDARSYRYSAGLVNDRWTSAARRVLLETVADATVGDHARSLHRLDRALVDRLTIPGSDVTVADADAGEELAAIAVRLWSSDRTDVYHRLPACFEAAERLTATNA